MAENPADAATNGAKGAKNERFTGERACTRVGAGFGKYVYRTRHGLVSERGARALMWAADVLLFVLCAFATCALVIKPPSWVGVFSVWMVLAVALLTQALVPSGLRILGAT